MTNTGGPTTPAGWFTDPGGSGHLRWWDGTAWTAHLAPQPTPAPTPVVPQPVVLQPVVQQPVLEPVQYAPVEQQAAVLTAENQPYVPFQGSWNNTSTYSATGAEDFARPLAWNTGWAWFLGASPIIFAGIAFAVGVLEGLLRGSGVVATSLAAVAPLLAIGELVLAVLVFVAAFRDRTILRSWGYIRVASPLWILFALISIGPLVYLIVRTVRVYSEVRRGIAPLILYVVSAVALGVLSVVVSLTLGGGVAGALGGATSAQFAASVQQGLDEKGGHFTVTCPPTIPTSIGSTFTCTAVDSAGTSHVLSIQVVTGSDGKPSVKLKSVTPPISG
jgi:hypothetical protein